MGTPLSFARKAAWEPHQRPMSGVASRGVPTKGGWIAFYGLPTADWPKKKPADLNPARCRVTGATIKTDGDG
jgi:hypothetical protein